MHKFPIKYAEVCGFTQKPFKEVQQDLLQGTASVTSFYRLSFPEKKSYTQTVYTEAVILVCSSYVNSKAL